MVYLLVAAVVVSTLLGDWAEAAAVAVVLLINAALGRRRRDGDRSETTAASADRPLVESRFHVHAAARLTHHAALDERREHELARGGIEPP